MALQKSQDIDFIDFLEFNIGESIGYNNTPLDAIPFAWTGSGGEHFCFLTDFGRIKDLERAPIIVVTPMETPPVQLVANNLKDFLKIAITVHHFECIGIQYSSLERMKKDLGLLEKITEQESAELKKWTKDKLSLKEFLYTKFQISIMEDPCEYIFKIRKERKDSLSIETNNEIGVVIENTSTDIKVFDYEITDISKIQCFLDNASKSEKINFYRDATFEYILCEDYDIEIRDLIIDELKKDGFTEEAEALSQR